MLKVFHDINLNYNVDKIARLFVLHIRKPLEYIVYI
jgi:hypothetical protein